jgi:small subunit ribosomal protein S20
MAHTKQSKKRIRQNENARKRNRSRMSKVRTAVRTLEASAGKTDADSVEKMLRTASSELDRAAKRNIIHPNAAARKKSRLAKKVAKAKA